MESSSKQYNNFADHYATNNDISVAGRVTMYKIINKLELEVKSVLDLGLGPGRDIKYFLKQKARVHGIDISKELVKIARNESPEADIKVGSFENLPYKDKSIYLVYSRYAMQHLKCVEKTIAEVDRILQPQGHFIFLVTHPFRQFLEKKSKQYWDKELIESNILGYNLTVKEYSYTMEEYLSPILLQNFTLEEFIEEHDKEAEQIEKMIYPGYMIMHYKKRLIQ